MSLFQTHHTMAAFTWLIAVAGVVITIFALYLSQETPLPDLPQDAYWGPGEAKPLSTEVKPFKVNIPASKIEDLNKRLDAARIGHTDVEDTQFNDGFNVRDNATYMRSTHPSIHPSIN